MDKKDESKQVRKVEEEFKTKIETLEKKKASLLRKIKKQIQEIELI